MKFFTLGWQAGVNVELGKFYVGLSYGGGLTDFVKCEDDYESYNFKLNNFAATIGLVF